MMIPSFDAWQAMAAAWKGGAVALGNFDGVHRGHQALLARTAEQAKALGAPVVALTFEPHPRRFFVPDTGPFRLTLPPARLRLLGQYGAQAVLAQRFDAAFADLSSDAFIDDVLLKGLGVRHVVCGYDFTFGARRGGNVERLREQGKARGFGVTVLDPVTHEGEIYSSTRIREALRAGWITEAIEHLGHPWEIEGVVELGDQRLRCRVELRLVAVRLELQEELGAAADEHLAIGAGHALRRQQRREERQQLRIGEPVGRVGVALVERRLLLRAELAHVEG